MKNMKLIMESFRKFTKDIRIVNTDHIDTESVLEMSMSCAGATNTWEERCYKDGVTKKQWANAKKAIANCGDDKKACEEAKKKMDDLINV